MSFCRRDSAKKLLSGFDSERDFIDAVSEEIKSGRLKCRDGEKAIIWYYQCSEKLLEQLHSSTST